MSPRSVRRAPDRWRTRYPGRAHSPETGPPRPARGQHKARLQASPRSARQSEHRMWQSAGDCDHLSGGFRRVRQPFASGVDRDHRTAWRRILRGIDRAVLIHNRALAGSSSGDGKNAGSSSVHRNNHRRGFRSSSAHLYLCRALARNRRWRNRVDLRVRDVQERRGSAVKRDADAADAAGICAVHHRRCVAGRRSEPRSPNRDDLARRDAAADPAGRVHDAADGDTSRP